MRMQQRCKTFQRLRNLLLPLLFWSFLGKGLALGPDRQDSCPPNASSLLGQPHAQADTPDALLDALLDPTVTAIQVINDMDMEMIWARWEAMPDDVVLTRSVTIFAGGCRYPVINFHRRSMDKGIRLGTNVQLTFAHLMFKLMKSGLPDIVKGGDCSSTVIIYDCIRHEYTTPPPALISLAVNAQPQATWAPEVTNNAVVLDDGYCRDDGDRTLCWKAACWVTCAVQQFAFLGTRTPGCLKVVVHGLVVVSEEVINATCLADFYHGNTTCLDNLRDTLRASENTKARRAATQLQILAAAKDLALLPPLPPLAQVLADAAETDLKKDDAEPSARRPSRGFIIGLSVGLVIGISACASVLLWVVLHCRLKNKPAAGAESPPKSTCTDGSTRGLVPEGSRDIENIHSGSVVVTIDQRVPASADRQSSYLRLKSLAAPISTSALVQGIREITPTNSTPLGPDSSEGSTQPPSAPMSSITINSRSHGIAAVSMAKLIQGIPFPSSDDWQVHVLSLGQVVTDTLPLDSDINLQVDIENDVAFGEMLGSGSMGTVYSGMYRGDKVAVKLFHPGADLRTFAQEIRILGRTRHPNVVQLLGVSFNDSGPVALLEELCHGSCEQLLYAAAQLQPDSSTALSAAQRAARKQSMPTASSLPSLPSPLPLNIVLSIGLQTANGLAYLHPTVIHRDLKPGNILLVHRGSRSASGFARSSTASSSLTQDPGSDPGSSSTAGEDQAPILQVKLSDFGLSRMRDAMTIHTQKPYCGTVPYMAPECFTRRPSGLTHKVDIYALGSCLWEMLHGIRPWQGFTPAEMMYQVAVRNTRPPIMVPDERCPRQLRKLIMRCWDSDPDRRPSALEVARELAFIQRHLGFAA